MLSASSPPSTSPAPSGHKALIASVIGNVIIWKPSPNAALTAIATTNIVNGVLDEMGLPPLFLLAVDEGRTIGEKLSNDKRIPLLSFTGSIRTGRRVAQAVAGRLGQSLLELGGNNAAIVTAAADPGIALRGVAFGSRRWLPQASAAPPPGG